MSRKSGKSQPNVERLLEERRQYEAWLAKLSEPAGAAVPSSVVEKVRADYRERLDSVTRLLMRHENELETALAEAEIRRDQLVAQRAARSESLAEAELRHGVGEYDEAKFVELSTEVTSALAQLAGDIEAAEQDIAKLEEVLGLVAGGFPPPGAVSVAQPAAPPAAPRIPTPASPAATEPARAEAAAVPPAAPPVPVASAPEVAAPPLVVPPTAEVSAAPAVPPPPQPGAQASEPAAASPVLPSPVALAAEAAPSAAEVQAAKQIDALDELDFIRSVVGPEEALPPPPTLRLPKPKQSTTVGPAQGVGQGGSAGNGRIGPLRPSLAEADNGAKTLRCTECGTQNLPTEWYCEKCGAELSAF